MFNVIKTVLLFVALSSLLIYTFHAVSRQYGVIIGVVLSILINAFLYFNSDKFVLSMYRAQSLSEHDYKWLYDDAQELTQKMNIPMPKMLVAGMPVANALAVGRNPSNASVMFTAKLLDSLEPQQIRGILAHELSHIKNRDTLLVTVATTMAGVIGYVGYMVRRGALSFDHQKDNQEARTPFADFILSFILPIGATLLRLAISRSREFDADATGAYYSHDPLALASALQRLEEIKKERSSLLPIRFPMGTMTEPLFIVSPFTSRSALFNLLSTHPPVAERIRRLKEIYQKMREE